MRRTPAPLLVALVFAACAAACSGVSDAQRAGQVRYEGHTLEEWWQLRRDPDDSTAGAARTAMHMLGAEAVPFLAVKAAGPDIGDVIGGGVGLESMCPNAIPAMQAARSRHPSAALDAAIRRVKANAAGAAQAGVCTAGGDPVRPKSQQPSGRDGA